MSLASFTLGRHEKRRRGLLIGWLNEHYGYIDVDSLVQRYTNWPKVGTDGAIDIYDDHPLQPPLSRPRVKSRNHSSFFVFGSMGSRNSAR
jgi:hypothetical protein